ncbi:GNAT family N-acetyltransferase [Nocardioides sp. JQ2195]|uniref:GNAT family N-acetyltransferase n=1 Tax=Nocardioides sp. JQ2195 TaxID=2592334 RepID=UPI00143E3B33|nr:GNAT family N-acetyltransferase [Nocardioides sp. JQ2195]QIX25454.1 GNAT family N-acetyltransferase [Nocardioides sp. JQ2195]
MIELVPPSPDLYDSWLEAEDEFGDAHRDGSGFSGPRPSTDRPAYDAMVADRLSMADPSTPVPEGFVHCTFLWMVGEAEFIGYLAIRHALTPFLLEEGGHVGYSVRPSRRQEGHATRALGLSLPVAESLGIERVLVTCDDDNIGSYRTIEANGGVLEDVRNGKRRYWLDASAR